MAALRNFNGLASWKNAENSLQSVNLIMPAGPLIGGRPHPTSSLPSSCRNRVDSTFRARPTVLGVITANPMKTPDSNLRKGFAPAAWCGNSCGPLSGSRYLMEEGMADKRVSSPSAWHRKRGRCSGFSARDCTAPKSERKALRGIAVNLFRPDTVSAELHPDGAPRFRTRKLILSAQRQLEQRGPDDLSLIGTKIVGRVFGGRCQPICSPNNLSASNKEVAPATPFSPD